MITVGGWVWAFGDASNAVFFFFCAVMLSPFLLLFLKQIFGAHDL